MMESTMNLKTEVSPLIMTPENLTMIFLGYFIGLWILDLHDENSRIRFPLIFKNKLAKKKKPHSKFWEIILKRRVQSSIIDSIVK